MPKVIKTLDVDCMIIGGGIIGSTIDAYMQQQGFSTMLVDCNQALAGTIPSGGHLNRSWFKGMDKKDYEPALEILNDLWGIKEETFQLLHNKTTDVIGRVNCDDVLKHPRTYGKVIRIEDLYQQPRVCVQFKKGDHGFDTVEPRLLIVAAGVWTNKLVGLQLPSSQAFQSKQGISYRYSGIVKPFIKQWAPYKQIVAHNQYPNEIWVGDGTAILQQNWTQQVAERCRLRCKEALPVSAKLTKVLSGFRPTIRNGPIPCLCRKIYPQIWVVTGASKLGTIAAGWAARKIVNAES